MECTRPAGRGAGSRARDGRTGRREGGPHPGRLAGLGRWCARHPWPVEALWIVLLAGATVGHRAVGGVALGLGISVLIDASIIRLVVVPASMFLIGRLNWWMPGWLDRIMPRLEAEGPSPGNSWPGAG